MAKSPEQWLKDVTCYPRVELPRCPQCIGGSIGPFQDQDVQMLPGIAR